MYKKIIIGQYTFFVFENQIDKFEKGDGIQKWELADIILINGVILKGRSLTEQILEKYLTTN